MKEPAILYKVHLTEADQRRLKTVMQNWLRVHAHMVRLPRTWAAHEELRRMLWYEIHGAKRMDIALRVFRRMMLLSKELHEKQLLELWQ